MRTRRVVAATGFAVLALALQMIVNPEAVRAEPLEIRSNDGMVVGFDNEAPYEEGDEESYWTQERMQDATPLDEDPPLDEEGAPGGEDGSAHLSGLLPSAVEGVSPIMEGQVLSEPVSPRVSGGATNDPLPKTTGKVFFQRGGKDYVCSGSVINSQSKSLVLTAGHCVYGADSGGWNSSTVFVPGYRSSQRPNGTWSARRIFSYVQWVDRADTSLDVGILQVAPRGQRIVDQLGGNGVAYNYGHWQTGVHVWGWPAEKPYDGEEPFYCVGNTSRVPSTSDMVIGCSMTGGSSGGPWFVRMENADLGYVFAVTSRRSWEPRYLYAAPFGAGILSLITYADGN